MDGGARTEETELIAMLSISRRNLITLGASFFAAGALAGCGDGKAAPGSTGASGKTGSGYKVGVLQLVEHGALDQTNKGFVAAVEEAGIGAKINQQNAQNDQSACQTIASTLVNEGCDLILAIATPAAQAVAGATSDIPIVCTAITDFAASGLVKDNDAPGGNVTGTSDMNPVVDQIDLLHQLAPEAKKVGLLYCTAESNSKIQIELAAAELKKLGIEGVEYTASSSNEVQQVVESMMGKVDAIYTPTDNTIASAMTVIASIANEHKVPTVCGEVAHVEAGGLASLSINYEELGRRAGEMAVRILTEGAEPAAMPIESMGAAECDLVYNGQTAEALGIDVTSLVEDGATDVSAAE